MRHLKVAGTLLFVALAALVLCGGTAQAGPGGGTYFANSPAGGTTGTPLRKFVDSLPGLGSGGANNLGQYIPVAVPRASNPIPGDNADYYDIGLVDYTQRLHSDLPKATKLRGYKDLNGTDNAAHYLGPVIIATRNKPVRVRFRNLLGAGAAGNLFIPVDNTVMGAGTGPLDNTTLYTENRTSVHLHGGNSPWISDGTPHQWFTPAAETSPYKKGDSFRNAPDDNVADGMQTLYWTNQQSGRLMFYHDHAYGTTRLNVYAGGAAGYLIVDPVEEALIDNGALPNLGGLYRYGIPLIIQDKTFVPQNVAVQDALWDTSKWGQPGDLWFPHVYEPNQDPNSPGGANPYGRWDYGPWFWPPMDPATLKGPLPQPSIVPEAFMDTAMVNGAAYPYLNVDPKAYRFRILNACNDRMLNLSLFVADATGTEVPMVPAVPTLTFPPTWPTDSRIGGTPDPLAVGPSFLQIGSEGGFLPGVAVVPPQPVTYDYNRRNIVVLNVLDKGLFMGPAERADVVVDFSAYAGKTVILYNDAPAPVPAFDPRYDYFTGNPDQTASGGAPSTLAGYGPNTRTIMQFRVANTTPVPFNAAPLTAALPAAFAATQPAPLVPESGYSAAYGTTFFDSYAKIQDTSMTFTPIGSTVPVTVPLKSKAIQELFDPDYGRMNAVLGVELPLTNFLTQTTIPYFYVDPPTEEINKGETQFWKITHNGVDTHAIHFHLVDVQVVNRVGWDGAIRPPDPNELGWKETVRMHPLEDIVVALKPKERVLPFAIDNSVRPLNPALPVGPVAPGVFTGVDPNNNPVTVSNDNTNFGNEYVWHCHLLGHEENDMMRPLVLRVPVSVPAAPTGLAAVAGGTANSAITLTWNDDPVNNWVANGYRIERRTGANAFAAITTVLKAGNVGAMPTAYSFVDFPPAASTTYDYRVYTFNDLGDSATAAGVASAATGAFTPVSTVTAVASPASPQLSGAQVVWTATATGGKGSYEYEYWLQTLGVWNVVKPYNVPGNQWLWDTTGVVDNTYNVRVWARNAGSAAASEATFSTTYTIGAGAATSVTFTPSLASPQVPGASITWTAVAAGGTGPYEYQIWFLDNTNTWVAVKPYTTPGNTYTWSTTGLPAKTYYFYAYARTVGSAAPYEAFAQVSFNLVTATAPNAVTLTPNPTSPMAARNSVVWTAVASGGTGPYEYSIWFWTGSAWNNVKPYATAGNTYSWNTAGLASGTYNFSVWARNVGSAAAWETATNATFTLTSMVAPTTASFTPSPAGPTALRTPVLWTAAASGGTGPYEYSVWYWTGSAWNNVQPYSTTATYTWNPAGLPAGTYNFSLWARNVGSTAPYEKVANATYQLTTPVVASTASLTPSPTSPQSSRPSVVWTAAASGGTGPYEYSIWFWTGSTWSNVKPYATAGSTYTWNTAGLPSGSYTFSLWVRNQGSTAAWEKTVNATFTLTNPVPPNTVTLVPSPTSPSGVGIRPPVIWTATASNGTGPYEYSIWYWNPATSAWVNVKPYATAGNTYTWNTAGLPNGTYTFSAWARNVGSSASWEAVTNATFTLQ